MTWLTWQVSGRTAVVALAPGRDPATEAARLGIADYTVHSEKPILPFASLEAPASLSPAQWSFLRRRQGGRLGAVIEAAKAAMPPGDAADLFAAIVDDSPSIGLATVLALTARVRAMGVPNVPTDADIRAAWDVALQATPEALLTALGG